MSYGPAPWVQRHWDLRAATNFVAGGIGAGLIVVSVASGASGRAAAIALVAGYAIVALGLTSVWFEIGRPWRALNVFRNPRTSWMSREAIVAVVLAGAAVLAAGLHLAASPTARAASVLAAVAALGFVYCQSRMLQAAKGIVAWRSPATPALIVATSLAEGAGAWWLAATWHAQGTRTGLAVFGALVVARLIAWLAYRRTLSRHPHVADALAPAGRVLAAAGTLAPLALVAVAALSSAESWVLGLAGTAGALALAAGAWFKVALIVRGAFNQGFAIPRMPVRGVRS